MTMEMYSTWWGQNVLTTAGNSKLIDCKDLIRFYAADKPLQLLIFVYSFICTVFHETFLLTPGYGIVTLYAIIAFKSP